MAAKGDGVVALIGMSGKGKSGGGSAPKSGSLGAAQSLIDAVKADDAEAVDEALKLHYSQCEGMGDEKE